MDAIPSLILLGYPMTTSTFLLSPKQKLENISILRELLTRADDLTQNFQDIENNLNDHDIWVYVVDEQIKYALTAQTVGQVYFIGKAAGSGKLFPWPDFLKELVQYSKAHDCVELMFSGESYWKDKVDSLGFEVKEYLYAKDLR